MYFVMFWKKVGLPPALFFSVCNIFTYYRIIFISFLILFAKEKKSVIAYLKNLSVCLQTPSILPFSFPSTIQTDFLSVKFIFLATINRLFFSYKQTFIPTKKTEKMSVLLWEKVGFGMKIGLFCNERKSVLARKKVGFFYI